MNELSTNIKTSLFDASQYNHWMDIATKLSKTTMIPKQYIGKPIDILVAMEMGNSVGLSMMQSLQSIAVINGTPSMYGDAPLAVCQNHPSFEWIKEEPIYKGDNIYGYSCIIKRKNNDAHTSIFTQDNAKKAGLWGKQGPWCQYPERMLQLRARGFALRNIFPDALKGIQIKEEVDDYIQIKSISEHKSTQKPLIATLLAKKGLNNDSAEFINANLSNHTNSDTSSNDGGLCSSNSNPSPQYVETEIRSSMASSGESKNSITVTQNEACAINESQLESIELLMSEKRLSKERQLKAFYHFGVASANELSHEQANEMIKILNRME